MQLFLQGQIAAKKRKYKKDVDGSTLFEKRKQELTQFDPKTIENLRVSVSACIHYSKEMLSLSSGKKYIFNYIPTQSFNQSILEVQFSLMRNIKLDTPGNYGSFIDKSFEITVNKTMLQKNIL